MTTWKRNWQAHYDTYVGRKIPERKRPMDGVADTNELVFVYGTLKKNRGNSHLLSTSRYIDRARTIHANYKMYDGGFPYVSYDPNDFGTCVYGELYLVTDAKVMQRLDRLEGVPDHYVRHPTFVVCETVNYDSNPSLRKFFENGNNFRATMYVASDSTKRRLDQRDPMVQANWPSIDLEEGEPILHPWGERALYEPYIEKPSAVYTTQFAPGVVLHFNDMAVQGGGAFIMNDIEAAPMPARPRDPWGHAQAQVQLRQDVDWWNRRG